MSALPNLDGKDVSIGIVVARFNQHITDRLLTGALRACEQTNLKSHEVYHVAGSFELPQLALHLARTGRFDAIVCLGAVVRHETDHYLHVATQTASGIQQVALQTGVPCAFGVLTCDTDAQALERSGEERNAGADAVLAAVEMANAVRSLA
jgi:6,7-dimethyl-8-ribityllumazine synthase